jgi:hypothetical protein
MVFTNQEGKIYYVTSFNYFIDLADLEIEFSVRGHFSNYRTNLYSDKNSDAEKIDDIAKTMIPPGRYFLQFNMNFISLRSYKF